MGGADFYARGSFNRICDRCGRKRKAYMTEKEWTGLIVCRDTCWEPRHPQDFLKGFADKQSVPDPRPEAEDQFVVDNLTAEDL